MGAQDAKCPDESDVCCAIKFTKDPEDGDCNTFKVTGDRYGLCLGIYTYINNLTLSYSPDYPVYKLVNATSVWCGRNKNDYADSCGGCPRGNGASWCKGSCQWTDQKCIIKESSRDTLLDQYVYFHP